MTRVHLLQSNFTAGELDPRLLGRTDLRSYQNGAAKLQNVVVETTGGVRRRPGTAFVASAPGRGRLASFESGVGLAYLILLTDLQLDIYRDGTPLATLATPWTEAQLAELTWAQFRDRLILAHPDVPPQILTRLSDVNWTIADLAFAEKTTQDSCAPFARFAEDDVTLQSSAASGPTTLTTSAAFFTADHLGAIVRIKGDQILITNVVNATQATGTVTSTLADLGPTTEWDEQAFSPARGWPVAFSFHQNRMVIGGSRDLPNGLWLSRSGQPFNFDLGTGLDDEAIAFRLATNDAPVIRSLVAGRHLQIFTSVGEWIVTGEPLTPINIQVRQQSKVGSPIGRQVMPRDVDGATLFAARNGREIREFLFTDTEQAYQAPDIALLARHLVLDPVDQAFDRRRRLFFIVMADGSLASIGIYRNADIVAWSQHQIAGTVLSITVVDQSTLLLVERANGVFLEELDDTLFTDSSLVLSEPAPTAVWTGLDHLEGETVQTIADGTIIDEALVTGGQIVLSTAAGTLTIGLSFTHVVEPLPPVAPGSRFSVQEPLYRPVRVVVRLFETGSLIIDTGSGLRDLTLDGAPAPLTGDVALRSLGWRRGPAQPPWRIEQSTPLPCTILSVTTEVKVNS